ncbi:DUF1289 domain-containing protein [bacterium]|nr:DUF1289 domain-containing protein [bacterium]
MLSNQTQSSPCNKHCIMDPVTQLCNGCFRTIEEIIQWTHSSNEIRKDIMRKVEARKSSSQENKQMLQ